MNYFRNNNGQRIYYREETKKDMRKSSEETVGVAFWPDLTQYFRGTQRGYSSKPLNIALLNVF